MSRHDVFLNETGQKITITMRTHFEVRGPDGSHGLLSSCRGFSTPSAATCSTPPPPSNWCLTTSRMTSTGARQTSDGSPDTRTSPTARWLTGPPASWWGRDLICDQRILFSIVPQDICIDSIRSTDTEAFCHLSLALCDESTLLVLVSRSRGLSWS